MKTNTSSPKVGHKILVIRQHKKTNDRHTEIIFSLFYEQNSVSMISCQNILWPILEKYLIFIFNFRKKGIL